MMATSEHRHQLDRNTLTGHPIIFFGFIDFLIDTCDKNFRKKFDFFSKEREKRSEVRGRRNEVRGYLPPPTPPKIGGELFYFPHL